MSYARMTTLLVFMPPTSKKLRGHIGLGLSVRLSVRNTFWQLRNSRTAYARILKFYMLHVQENKRTSISSAGLVVLELCPFFDYVWTTFWTEYLKNRLGQDPDIYHIVTNEDVDELINFWTYSVNFWLSYSPFSDIGILYRNNLVNEILKILYMACTWKISGPVFFFLRQFCRSGVMPLFRLCMNNLVNRISEEPIRLGSWYMAYGYRPRCRWSD